MLRFLPALTLMAMLGPVVAGLLGALLPASGHLPAAGFHGPSLLAVRQLLDWPGLAEASRLSVTTGVLATAGSLGIVTLIVAGWSGTRAFAWLERALSPLLSVPHAAAAFGLAFLVAPSGWLMRLVAPLAGWERPPDMLIVGDSFGLTMTAGLIAKEVPFLLLMTLAALPQARGTPTMLVARSLGYGRMTGWLKTVFPSVYAQIRLPVYVVLAYSMSVVDVALILGPTTPATLSVQIVHWMGTPELSARLTAAAGAIWQAILVGVMLLLWRAGEHVLARQGRRWAAGGRRTHGDGVLRAMGLPLAVVSALSVLLGLVLLALWSVATRWRWPELAPSGLTMRTWSRHASGISDAAGDTFLIAGIVTGMALVLTIGCLESEHRFGREMTRRATLLLYLPLLVPQTAFLPGLQTFLLSIDADTGRVPVIAAHLVFVLPYVFLSLGDPWRAWDVRNATVAAGLGASPDRVLLAVRLPMLLGPLLTAVAIGVAVSVGLYLPTLLIGGGRVSTLTTEAVSLSSGGDRRAIGAFALAQTAAALLPFALAIGLPALVYRNRRGLRG
ncbi:putative thiamine transport system permease protein [Palleronia marisminoris]|uniref:Inner membrane ABC transporter permease protein YnjC n=1 Tax=Palleronia marisminoris TaxID=315423 RepID=A0A1Y5SWQ4_9RHOB|nr:ABC transporter permease [Palleronia marisminoris]SFG95203.1 putative thiamine transport system permease protein [Palleronia marisminoris]SLN46829.1 Inner membrane ABC transporter permease protein YnjC [Palleronia marisminoris]